MVVWDAPGVGFGDLFVAVNFCAHQSLKTRSPAFISERGGIYHDHDHRARLQEIIAVMDFPSGCSVEVVPDLPNAQTHGEPWGYRYFPTRVQWRREDRLWSSISFQFDGRSSAHLKNPPAEDVAAFESWAAAHAVSPHYVGLPSTVAECIEILASSRLFVGANSGMSHLALSVGVPTFVVEYGVKIDWWYGPNPVRKCLGMQDFFQKVMT